MAAYGTVEAIPRRSADWAVELRGAIRLAATLDGKREEARLYKRLATLATHVPLAETLSELRWRGARQAHYRALETSLVALPQPPRFRGG